MSGQGTERLPYPTICRCGLAKSYHRPEDRRDHEYVPRYEPEAWRDGYQRGQAEAQAQEREAIREAVEGLPSLDMSLPDGALGVSSFRAMKMRVISQETVLALIDERGKG